MKDFISSIILPTRPQPDTIVAIFLLIEFGEKQFPGVGSAKIVADPNPETGPEVLLLDVGGGELDHHGTDKCASEIVAEKLQVESNPALRKLLAYARRDDMEGKGTLSNDPIDRTFGLSGLIANLNKQYPKDTNRVVTTILPLLKAQYYSADEHYNKLPKLVTNLNQTSLFEKAFIKNSSLGNIKAAFVSSNNVSLAGYLRSQTGGNYRVVVQRGPSGHVNIITKQQPKIDLSRLAAMIRMQECVLNGNEVEDEGSLYQTGTHTDVQNWYYDPATNSLLNGGVTPDAVEPTSIQWEDMCKIVKHCLSQTSPE